MAVESSGTQTAVVGTEHSLYISTAAKTLTLIVDTNNMLNGDELELRVKAAAISAGTRRLVYLGVYAHVQVEPLKVSVPVPSPYSWEASLKQTAGTARTYDWVVVSA
jgi:hypothetical protein